MADNLKYIPNDDIQNFNPSVDCLIPIDLCKQVKKE